jgi:3-phosphoshikimate 1-carboxyvinyltransferase
MPPPSHIDMIPLSRPFHATVRVPGSKSITNRALPLAATAAGETELTGVLLADDTWHMIHALQALGWGIEVDQKARRVRVIGLGGDMDGPVPAGQGQVINCGNSGTTIRFLTAILALGHGDYVLDGNDRMRQRPLDQLVDQLRGLGAEISHLGTEGYPPIRIRCERYYGLGGTCQFAHAKSSQFISAVLLAAPQASGAITVNLVGPVTSEPYVTMTLRMLEQFGVGTEISDPGGPTPARAIRIPHCLPRAPGGVYAIEPDASNASYFLAAAAIVPGSRVTAAGLGRGSLQGDVAFADVLARMGATVEWRPEGVTVSAPADGKLRGIDLDMNHIPDMVQTLAVVALFAEGPTTIRNVWNLRVKETDRLAALEAELRKLGATVETGKDWIRITPPPAGKLTPAAIKTYDDHRMAMSFAVAGLRAPGVRIEDPGCTAKTYPEFFDDLQAAVKSTDHWPLTTDH